MHALRAYVTCECSTSELRPAPSIPDTTIFVVSGVIKFILKKKKINFFYLFFIFAANTHVHADPHHRDRWDQEEGAHLQEHDRRGQRGQGRRPAEAGRHRQVRKVRARVPQHPRTYRRYVRTLFMRLRV